VPGDVPGDVKDRARTVVIGAGIVGASAAYHLAELGERDLLVLDQGQLFETGGSSSHAPGLAFQTNGSRMMCRIAQDSVALYDTLDVDGERVWYGVGGLELATTSERIAELKRRQGFARALMGAAEERLRALGCAKINLQIRQDNSEAIAFYRRLGFAEDASVSMGKRLERDDN